MISPLDAAQSADLSAVTPMAPAHSPCGTPGSDTLVSVWILVVDASGEPRLTSGWNEGRSNTLPPVRRCIQRRLERPRHHRSGRYWCCYEVGETSSFPTANSDQEIHTTIVLAVAEVFLPPSCLPITTLSSLPFLSSFKTVESTHDENAGYGTR